MIFDLTNTIIISKLKFSYIFRRWEHIFVTSYFISFQSGCNKRAHAKKKNYGLKGNSDKE